MTIQDFSYTINNTFVWIALFLLSLRAVYKCLFSGEEIDYAHAAAFMVVLFGSAYMLAALNGLAPIPNFYEQ